MRHFNLIMLFAALTLGTSAFGRSDSAGDGGGGRDRGNYMGGYSYNQDFYDRRNPYGQQGYGFFGRVKQYACGFSFMSSMSTCAMMHPEMKKMAKKNPYYRDIAGSTNPDVSVSKYLEIEKQYAARGEPLNAPSLVDFMSYLSKTPAAKCEFDRIGAGAYGLACNNSGKVTKFAGLSEKLLNDHFAKYNKVQPVETPVVTAQPTVAQPAVTESPVVVTTASVGSGVEVAQSPKPEEPAVPVWTGEGNGTVAGGGTSFVDVLSPASANGDRTPSGKGIR